MEERLLKDRFWNHLAFKFNLIFGCKFVTICLNLQLSGFKGVEDGWLAPSEPSLIKITGKKALEIRVLSRKKKEEGAGEWKILKVNYWKRKDASFYDKTLLVSRSRRLRTQP